MSISSGDDSAEVAPPSFPSKRRRSVVPDTEDDLDEVPSPPRPSRRRRAVVPDSDDDSAEGVTPPYTCHRPCVREHASASAQKLAASAASRQSHHGAFAASDIPEGDMPTGDEDDSVIATIPAELAVGIDVGEDSDEEDEFFPGPDPTVEDEVVDESSRYVYNVNMVLEVSDAEVNPDFARTMRIILDTLCQWGKSIPYADFKAMAREDRPITFSVWKLLQKVRMEYLLAMYIPAIPIKVQELFSKKELRLEDLFSLPEVDEDDGQDQGIYGNFPTGALARIPNIGCECYVGSTVELLKRINEHLTISSRHSVSTLPKGMRRSLHYRTTCRENVVCNFRKLAGFKQSIPKGYLILLESIFMVLLGTYKSPGYCTEWATASSYKWVKDLRGRLNLPATTWRGLNAAWPLRQGFTSGGNKVASECGNPACRTMTYPPSMMPDGPKHPRALADSWNPLGGYLCRRCESYRERRGELPDNATLVTLTNKYITECTKSDLREAGLPVVCAICGVVEGADGAANSARGYGTRHIAKDDRIICMPCDAYRHRFGKDRSPEIIRGKAIHDRMKADRAAGRPLYCERCHAVEPADKKRLHKVKRKSEMLCHYCYNRA